MRSARTCVRPISKRRPPDTIRAAFWCSSTKLGTNMKIKLKTVLANIALTVLTVSAAIAVGSQVPKLCDLNGNVKNGEYAEHVDRQPQRLTLYGTTTCPHCVRARQFLVRSGIPFNDIILDTSSESRNMFAKLNEDGVPVLVSRTQLVSGFNSKAFSELARASSRQ